MLFVGQNKCPGVGGLDMGNPNTDYDTEKGHFQWQQMSHSVAIGGNSMFAEQIEHKMNGIRECMEHELLAGLLDGLIRRYRRGKNRCVRCGLKCN